MLCIEESQICSPGNVNLELDADQWKLQSTRKPQHKRWFLQFARELVDYQFTALSDSLNFRRYGKLLYIPSAWFSIYAWLW